MKLKSIFLIFLLIIQLVFSGIVIPIEVDAQTAQQKLEQLQKDLERIANEKAAIQKQLDSNNYVISGYNSQVSKLQGEIALFQKDLDSLAIEIQALETTVEDLTQQIETKENEINSTEVVVNDLDFKSNNRIKNNYMNFRMYGTVDSGSSMLIVNDLNKFFKESQYKELIQENTNDMLVSLAVLKTDLLNKKVELENNKIEIDKEKELLDIKKIDLDKKQEDVQSKLDAYYAEVGKLESSNNQGLTQISSLNDQEMKLSARAELIKQEIMLSSVATGIYVEAGTIIGIQGCTGYCFGEHLHFSTYYNGVAVNPCSQIQPTGGCGSSGNPLQSPFRGSISYNSGFGWRSFDNAFHDGIDVTGFPLGAPVYAAHSGYITRGQDCYHKNLGYASTCANYIRISENKGSNAGYVTGYWHLK